jgi:thiol-disulfide isomerase/thioredoxin
MNFLSNLFFGNGPNEKPTFVMYHANWCGHCLTAKPTFKSLQTKYKSKIIFKDIEQKNIDSSVKIDGFPTFVLYAKNKKMEYQGDRSVNSFSKFLDENI